MDWMKDCIICHGVFKVESNMAGVLTAIYLMGDRKHA